MPTPSRSAAPSRAAPLLRRHTVQALEDWLTSYATVDLIGGLCEDAGIGCNVMADVGKTSSQRRAAFRQHLATLDLSTVADAGRLLRVFQAILDQLADAVPIGGSVPPDEQRATLVRALARDGIQVTDGRLRLPATGLPSLDPLRAHAATIDAAYLERQARRLESAADDPWLTIGTARELVETVCRTILSERGIDYEATWDFTHLVGETRKALRITAADVGDNAKAAKLIKTLLNNLGTIANGLAELRNAYGTGHGAEGRARGLEPRHARLAAGAAITLATFLFDTHVVRRAALATSGAPATEEAS